MSAAVWYESQGTDLPGELVRARRTGRPVRQPAEARRGEPAPRETRAASAAGAAVSVPTDAAG